MDMDYTIRALTVEDKSIVWEMLRYASHEPSVEAVQNQPFLARYASGWGRAGDVGCVATKGTASIGAAWLRLWVEEDNGFGYISDEIPELAMAVLPNCRGQGIGTRLLMQVLEVAKDRFPAVSLNVRGDNCVVRLYERAGFIKVPGSDIINRAGGVSFNMVCDLN
jgi:ribosomal protein S18 acetylase RimI-like enzyme